MKILAALKRIKHLDRKIQKTRERISTWCSYIVETDGKSEPQPPVYSAEDIRRMQQQIGDWATEKARIRHALHRTNMETVLEFDGGEGTVDELLLLQNVVLPERISTLKVLRRKEKGRGFGRHETIKSWVEMQYDPRERDKELEKLEKLQEELDELLDSNNIETDVVGL